MDYEKLAKLKGKEEGERLDIKQAYKWVLNDMEYKDFRALTELRFKDCSPNHTEYEFSYKYMTDEEHDSPKARQDYLKYFFYKLIQNIYTEGIDLR